MMIHVEFQIYLNICYLDNIVSRAVSMMLHFMYSELNALKRSQDGFCNYLFIRAEA